MRSSERVVPGDGYGDGLQEPLQELAPIGVADGATLGRAGAEVRHPAGEAPEPPGARRALAVPQKRIPVLQDDITRGPTASRSGSSRTRPPRGRRVAYARPSPYPSPQCRRRRCCTRAPSASWEAAALLGELDLIRDVEALGGVGQQQHALEWPAGQVPLGTGSTEANAKISPRMDCYEASATASDRLNYYGDFEDQAERVLYPR
ncbi:hypothetical protein DL766_001151 [Monosporascus sp. MC13-8B]|nr:hypothetical protein DL766_001151 [Monosporascus sp. MC13-8B]